MSTKKNGKNSNNNTPSDDLTDWFFSDPTTTPKSDSTKTSVETEEDSSEDFGYAGSVEDAEITMGLDDGSDATDVFNRAEYDDLLQELDAQGDVGDALSEDSSDESPELELVSKFRKPAIKEPKTDPGLMDTLLQEFSEDLGEPLGDDTTDAFAELDTQIAEATSGNNDNNTETFSLDAADPFGDTDPFVEDDSGDFLEGLRGADMPIDSVDALPGSGASNMSLETSSLTEDVKSDLMTDPLLGEDILDPLLGDALTMNEPIDMIQDSGLEDFDSSKVTEKDGEQAVEAAEATWDNLLQTDPVMDSVSVEETFDGWGDQGETVYKPRNEKEHFQNLRSLYLQEGKLLSNAQDKQHLWAECARISMSALREDAKALEYFKQANNGDSEVLRNADLKSYAEAAARTGQTRLYLEVLQQWALEREGTLAAEAWGDIAIFLQKRFGNAEMATDAIQRSLEADDQDWLNWQFLCQIQEGAGEWAGLVDSLASLERLSSGPLAAKYAYQQAMVYLHRLKDLEQGVNKLKEVLDYGENVGAAIALLKVGIQLDDSDTINLACNHVWERLTTNSDRLLWALHLYQLTHGAYGQDKLLASIDIHESIESFWLYLALLESGEIEEKKRVLLEATEQDRPDLALVWFHLSLLFEQEDDVRAGEALLKTVELDPFAIIAVDDYVEHLIAKEAFEECVDWLVHLYDVVLPEVPEVALAYLAQAAFIADAYLNDAIRAANMLSQAAAEESELSYLAETLYLRGEHWEALIGFYKRRAQQANSAEDSAHWMIQAGIIAETRLNQVEQAEELYALAREKSAVATIGITDVLRLRIRSGDWQEVVDIIGEQAENAIDPAGMYFMAANVSHCLLQSEQSTIENLKKCLEHSPSHVAALLLYRRITTDEERLWANQELLKHLSHKTICGWLQWENSNQTSFDLTTSNFGKDSIFFLERLFVLLLSEFDVAIGSVKDIHPLVDTLLLTKASAKEVDVLVNDFEHASIGQVLFLESLGKTSLQQSQLSKIDSKEVLVKEWKARAFEQSQQLEQAEKIWLSIFEDESASLTYRTKAALALDGILRHLPERHLELAKVHSTLASWIDDDSPINYFALLAAQLFSSLGNVSEATSFFKLRFQKNPVLGKVFQGLKSLYLQTHNVEDMQEILGSLDELVLLDFAEIMEEFREYGKAAEAYAKMLELSEKQSLSAAQTLPYYARMERCYEKSGDWSSVLAALEKQRDMVSSMEFQHYLDSKIQWVLVDHLAESDLALETYQRMLQNDPANRSVLKALARISIQHDQIDEAIAHLNTLAENPTDLHDAIEIMNTLVEAHQAQGDIHKEIEVLKDIIDIDSANLDAIDQLADCLQQQGEWKELFALLQRRSVLSEEHDKVACHTRIARIAEERLLDVDLALKEWSKVYEILGPEEETLRRLIHLSKSQFDTASFLHYADELIGLLEGQSKAELCMEIAETYINELLEESKAIPYLEVALFEDSTFERAVSYLENQYQIMSEWQKLLDLLLHKESKIEDKAEKVSILLKAAEIAEISLQHQEQADEIFAHIAILAPSNPASLKRRATTHYQNQDWEELLALYQEHGSIFKDSPRSTVDMLLQQSEAAEFLEQWDLVVSSLQGVLEVVPTHQGSLQRMSSTLLTLDRISEAVEIDKQLLEVMTTQGDKSDLAQVCLRLGWSSLKLEQWAAALQYFQKSRIYAPRDTQSLKGIIECSWQKGEYSRVAQLCSTLVKNATSEADVMLGYLWRGFTLDTKLQRQELAEQHYWRVLEFEQNNAIALFYVASISMRKEKWKSMFGQLTQSWTQLLTTAEPQSALLEGVAMGRLLAAQKVGDDEAVQEMQTWISEQLPALNVQGDLEAEFMTRCTARLFHP